MSYGVQAVAIALSGWLMVSGPVLGAKPNVLFIIVDDQSPMDLRLYDPRSTLATPVLEKLASAGMTLESAYHMGSFVPAVCTPSRHMLMCGRSLWHLSIGPGAATCPPQLELQTLPAVFNRAGYVTFRTCKVGNSYEGANRQFRIRHDATRRGGDDASGSAWHAEQVLAFLKDRQASVEKPPFFIYLGFSHPHDPREGKAEFLAKYGAVNPVDETALPPTNAKTPPLPVNYLPAHPFDHGHLEVRDEVAVSGVGRRRDERTIRNEIGRQYACSEFIDQQIGRVLDALQAMGELDNTYIFYTSDHGIAIGRHGLMGKQNLYEHSWRVPFIAKGPGIPAGQRVPGNVYLMDVLATLCDLAGIPPPPTNEGLSFRSVLEGQKTTLREVLYGVYSGGSKPGIRAVRRGDWKLIQYESGNGQERHTQLFNLAENPDELLAEHHAPAVVALTGQKPKPTQRNLADDPRHAEQRRIMEALLLSEMRRWNDPDRFKNQPPAERAPRPENPPQKAGLK